MEERGGRGDGWTLEHLGLVAADLGAWDFDIAENRVTWSDRVYELFRVASFGHTVEAFIALVHPDDRELMTRTLTRAIEVGPDDWAIEHRLANAPDVHLACRGRVFRDGAGVPVRLAGVVQDVSGRRRAERERRDQDALMRAALESNLFAVVVVEPPGRIIYCNQLAADLLGMSREDLTTHTYDAPKWKHTDVDGSPLPGDQLPFGRVMRTGEPVRDVIHSLERADGRRLIVRVNAAPVKDDQGRTSLVVFSFEDITERRAIEDALRQSQKIEAIGRLAGGVAHDFNNLLTAILSFTSLARRHVHSPNLVLQDLDEIGMASERAAALTRQLLAFGRRDVSRPTVFDARALVAESVRMLGRVVGEHVSIDLKTSPAPCWVRMDEAQLQQVLVNLAVNARDAMVDGGRLSLDVDVYPEEGVVRIRVSDTGIGMDEATLRKAFEPFFTTKPIHEGTGLGLSTCHGIVTNAGGRLTMDSELGCGTRVFVQLPLSDAPVLSSQAPPPSSSTRKVRGRVLVIEDDPSVRTAAVRALRASGFQVIAAASGDEALAVARSQRFDVAVCDVVLPGRSGFDVIAALREEHPDVRVLFVSGYTNELPRAGDDAFLAKPYTPDALDEKVREVLAG
ncbi:MAG: response regulator [Deltaproteobacteria bacterium]|nr:response regulator [Deltaproteobacteria bacterium]